MFFIIAGIQPKTVPLDDQVRMCDKCGLYQARLKRADHYLSIFFLPIFRVKKGTPYLECMRCGSLFQESDEIWQGVKKAGEQHCSHCGRLLNKDFHYCPYCGKGL